jgi:5-methylcytosine-specific restriction enzyme subunit McrC
MPIDVSSPAPDGIVADHQLHEWEARRFDGEHAIPVAEAARLARAAAGPAARLKGRAFEFGRDALVAQNLVGLVAAAGTRCEILPKVDRHAAGDAPQLRGQLIRMLAVAHDLPIADDVATGVATQTHDLLELLITRFALLLREAVRRGIPRAYVAHADDLPRLRGRLDVARQFTTLAASPQALACRYDEFSDDIALNQVMKAAIARLRRLARSTANTRMLGDLALVYADIAAVPAAALRWDRIVPDRTNARWQGPLRLARLILGDRFQNSSGGDADGFALLFDMNVLFERYVEKLLAPIAGGAGWRMVAQGGFRRCLYPEDGAPAMFATKPDLQLVRGRRVGLVIDAKWKCLADRSTEPKMGVDQADLYQMMAYARLYDCPALVLLYPRHAGWTSPDPVHHRVAANDGATRLTVASVDLTSHAATRAGLKEMVALAVDDGLGATRGRSDGNGFGIDGQSPIS